MVTISNGRNGIDDLVAVDLRAGARRSSSRLVNHASANGTPTRRRAVPRAAVGLVEADDQLVAVLGALDGVDEDARGVGREPRVRLPRALAEQQRRVEAQGLVR